MCVCLGGIKGKVYPIKALRGSRWEWVITAALQSLYPWEGDLVPKCTGGWVGPRASLAGCEC